MNKSKAFDIFADLVGLDLDAQISVTTDPEIDKKVYSVVVRADSITVDQLVAANDVLGANDAFIEVPSLRVVTNAEMEQKLAAEAAQAEVEAEAARQVEESLLTASLAGGSAEIPGGVSRDTIIPTPEPSPQPFAGEGSESPSG